MDSNLLQHDLRDDKYFILKLRNEILVSFDKTGQHSKLLMYTQRSGSGI